MAKIIDLSSEFSFRQKMNAEEIPSASQEILLNIYKEEKQKGII